jgi:hypothetical protein
VRGMKEVGLVYAPNLVECQPWQPMRKRLSI